ncbi:MAG: hypothetical protein D6678_07800 [Zetaproteobacteria bacterium]|nr:MAG: hypothetical protein D6678_07800 [Zetaproteobacteria bacterium]
MRTRWADFRIPPINLWVMPAWHGVASVRLRPETKTRRDRWSPHPAQARIRELLAARGGNHGH